MEAGDALTQLQAIAQGEEMARSEEIQALLRQILQEEWGTAVEEATQAALDAIAGGEGSVGEALAAMQGALGNGFRQRVSDAVIQSVEASYTVGQEGVDVSVAGNINVTDRRAQRWLQEDSMYWIGSHYDRQLRDRLREKAEEAIGDGDGLGRRRAGQLFQEEFSEEFGQSNTYWELMSNHVTTRSREFGRVEAFVKAGVEKYQIDAVLDRRTSEICEYLDGKVFDVSDAVAVRDELMGSEEPQDVKDTAPWLEPETLTNLSPSALAERGVVIPPFHAHCRSRTNAVPA